MDPVQFTRGQMEDHQRGANRISCFTLLLLYYYSFVFYIYVNLCVCVFGNYIYVYNNQGANNNQIR